jgi:acyl-CoA reductase-like NAD-dependent aldehyde dehydrogenase
VTRFSSDEEAVRLVNNTPYGLANILWTKDIDRALTTARRLRSGSVWINTTIAGPPQLPFGGYKGSGSGREIGEAGLEEFTEIKTIAIGTGKRHAFFTS